MPDIDVSDRLQQAGDGGHEERSPGILTDPSQSFDGVLEEVGRLFSRSEPREQAMQYISGLLNPDVRNNSRSLSKFAGRMNPWGFQRLLTRANWDHQNLLKIARSYITSKLSDSESILTLGELAIVKKGETSVGVAHQFAASHQRLANCQVVTFLGMATRRGTGIMDRELFLPRAWVDDPKRRLEAGIPPHRPYFTKPQMARMMLERYMSENLPYTWLTGGIKYGQDRDFRDFLEARRIPYVLEVPVARLPASGGPEAPKGAEGYRYTLFYPVRRSDQRNQALLAFHHDSVDTSKLLTIHRAGQRFERFLNTARHRAGIDQYEVRRWTPWHRHTALALLAAAHVSVVEAHLPSSAV